MHGSRHVSRPPLGARGPARTLHARRRGACVLSLRQLPRRGAGGRLSDGGSRGCSGQTARGAGLEEGGVGEGPRGDEAAARDGRVRHAPATEISTPPSVGSAAGSTGVESLRADT